MKTCFLAAYLLLFTASAYAQTNTIAGSLKSSDPTIAGSRLTRNGVYSTCAAPKAFPGTFGATGVHYHAYTLQAPTASTCLTVTYAPQCSEGTGANTFLSVYTTSFDPTNLATNYVSDMGNSPNDGSSISNSFTIPAGARYVLVVNGIVASTSCSAYTITLSEPLPVELVSFSAAPAPTGTALTWATASELNSAYFEVERSSDGARFAALGQVAGAGTSVQAHRYAYLDAPAPAGLSYYRLRQVDLNGSAHFSPVVTVQSLAATLSQSCGRPGHLHQPGSHHAYGAR
jgi:hypothetical protein